VVKASWVWLAVALLFAGSAPSTSLSPAAAGEVAQLKLRSALGTNLEAVSHWSPQLPFVDVMKSSSEWWSGDAATWDNKRPLDLDANGWVRSLAPGQIARKLMLREFGERYPAGRYLVRYKGEGTLKFAFAAKLVSQKPGEMLIEVTPSDGGIYLSLEATDPADYLRELEIIMPGGICANEPFKHAASANDCGGRPFKAYADDRSILFNPVFADRLRGYSVLRFMDWMGTNNSAVATWAQRTPLAYSTWARASGVPVEVMLALANLMGAHPWFTLPHQSDEAYAQSFAQLVKARLDPALGVYVEHSNEVWNAQFGQHAGLAGHARALGLDVYQYHALRTRTLAGIFKAELGAARVVAVLGAQAVNTWTASRALDYLKGRFGAAVPGIDALAIAPYFAVSPVPAQADKFRAMTLDALFTHVRAAVLPDMASHMARYRSLAGKHGVRLIAYEGGQHMVGVGGGENDPALNALFDSFNRDPRIRQLYLDYLGDWKRVGGELFVHFNDVSRYNKWGRYGALEYVAQPRSDAPKFDALHSFIEHNPVWWAPQ
jgi:hypothetical protein